MKHATAPLQTTSIATSSLHKIPTFQQLCRSQFSQPSPQKKSFPSVKYQLRTTTAVRECAPADISSAIISSTAEDVVREFYDGINRRDLASVAPLISEDCVYEDLVFSTPFVGRKAILEFFGKFMGSISSDFKFCIDDISSGDSLSVGLTWHLEWQGKPFPFSRGCSFYRLDLKEGKKLIVYGRDSVEPALKPGESTLVIIQGVAWILKRFPQLVELM